jgi:formylglycine-generating enzyme required for sulfatase activity
MKKYILSFLMVFFAAVHGIYAQKQGFTNDFKSVQEIRNYLSANITLLDPLEGEYDVDGYGDYITPFVHQQYPHNKFKVYIVSDNNNKFYAYNSLPNGDFGESYWRIEPVGETNAYWMYFYSTSTRIYLKDNIHFSATFDLDNASAKKVTKNSNLSTSVRVILYNDCVKTYPTLSMYANAARKAIEEAQPKKWTGTGFALNNNYIVTNNHVVDGAKTISIQGINGDFNHKYNAEVIKTDKVNDLAIIKVNGTTIPSASIPYAVKVGTAEVGEEVFVLGYPLTSTMGEEIKLTTGVISSKTGFQGDVSIYQISAPIQPGNSGGPLFDSKGNVVGIVSAKHKGAENVGYAIKTSYLKNLMESAVSINILPQKNKMVSQNLSGKVKQARDYVYYITCSSIGDSSNKSSKSIGSSTPPPKNNISPADPQKTIQKIISNMVLVQGGEISIAQTIDDTMIKKEVSSFSIGRYEVTQEEWQAIMKTNPSRQVGNKLPVHNISWNDCQTFIRKLNELTGKQFRLPTEVEWEYAAKGGHQSQNYKFAGNNNVESVAWYNQNCNGKIHPVGEKSPNELGLYDMSGNLKEWCQEKIDNSQIKTLRWTPGSSCIIRGGSWLSGAGECEVTNRNFVSPEVRDVSLGFRLAL